MGQVMHIIKLFHAYKIAHTHVTLEHSLYTTSTWKMKRFSLATFIHVTCCRYCVHIGVGISKL